MITPIEFQLNDATLSEWRGARVKIVRYQVEGKKLGMILYEQGDPELLLVVAVGCKNISGPLSWKNCCIAIIVESEPYQDQEGKCLIIDAESDFTLLASGAYLYRIPTVDFDNVERFMEATN